MKTILIALLTGSALAGAAQAQTVYRCGNAYSHVPCADARVVDAADPRTDGQRAEAQRVAEADRRLAAEMRRDRLADERAARTSGAASLSGVPRPKFALVAESPKKKARRTMLRALVPLEEVAVIVPAKKRRSSSV